MRSIAFGLVLLCTTIGLALAQTPAPAPVTLPATPPPAAAPAPAIVSSWHGLTVVTVTPEIAAAKKLMLPFGALVTVVEPQSPAFRAQVLPGDVIVSMDGQPITDAPALDTRLAKLGAGSDVTFGYVRGGVAGTVKLRLIERPKPKERAKPKPDGQPHVSAVNQPRLMLDTGGHTSIIKGLIWHPDGKQMITGGDDKVVRVWDIATGRTVRTIRGDADAGAYGQIFAMALSPDAKWLAVAGFMAPGQGVRDDDVGAIRMYDYARGELVAVLSAHSNVVNRLMFSPDGKRMISGQGGPNAHAVIWEAGPEQHGGWRVAKKLHKLQGHKLQIYAVGFSPDGRRAVTGSYDKTARLWDVESGTPIGPPMAGHAERITALAINPKDGSVFTGGDDGEIRVWDGTTGKFQRLFGQRTYSIGVMQVLPDQQRVLVSCAQRCDGSHGYVYDLASGKELIRYSEHDNIVLAATTSPDAKWVATGGGNRREIHIWDLETGKRQLTAAGQPVMFGGTGSAVWGTGFSTDNRRMGWGEAFAESNPFERGPIGFSLRLPATGESLGRPEVVTGDVPAQGPAQAPVRTAIRNSEKIRGGGGTVIGTAGGGDGSSAAPVRAPPQWVRARGDQGDVSLAHRSGGTFDYADGTLDIRRGGKVAASITRKTWDGFQHRSYTVTPDAKAVISGGAGGLVLGYDLDGRGLADFVGHESDIWAVAPSADGRFLITGSADQTVRLWNLQSLKDADVVPTPADDALPPKKVRPVVTLFHGRDGEWVMWTEEGYYTGSPGAGRIVGWQVSNGPGNAADYVTGNQVRAKLLRPDIVENAIRLGSSKAAIKAAGMEGVSIETLMRDRPPVIHIDWDGKNLTAFGGRTTIVVYTDPEPAPVTEVAISVTGLLGETRVDTRPVPLPPGVDAMREDGSTATAYEVPLFGGGNIIRVIAKNLDGESQTAVAGVDHMGEGALDKRGTLWIVAVGVNEYPKAKIMFADLSFASKDAEGFAVTAEASMKAGHARVVSTVLVNGRGPARAPTRANITAALDRVLKESGPNDTVVVFLAGHGENWAGGRYHFLPTDLDRPLTTDKGQNVLDWNDDIQSVLARSKGRKLLFLDACHSGSAYNHTLLAGADADRFVAFAAAGPGEPAIEYKDEGHGAFTWSVMQGLKGHDDAMDPLEKGVTVYRLGSFLSVDVRRRTQGAQSPEYRSGQGNFVLARR